MALEEPNNNQSQEGVEEMDNATEHELTEEKVAELWDANAPFPIKKWGDLTHEGNKDLGVGIARDAYDLGKAAQSDDGFIPCEFEDIRKGDTVERTWTFSDGSGGVGFGVASHRDSGCDWVTRDGTALTFHRSINRYTYRRKPAKVTLPDPDEHPIILDDCNEAWFWIEGEYRHEGGAGAATPAFFGNDWVSAKVVADTEED